MFERMRRALVKSYVGAVGLGYLLARSVMYFADVFATPLLQKVVRTEFARAAGNTKVPAVSPLDYAMPSLVSFAVLLLIWFLLFRWLYLKPLTDEAPEPRSATSPPSA